eukprot:SAG31_NODE_403_length_16150_cov_12.566588_10_plen_194_part_00
MPCSTRAVKNSRYKHVGAPAHRLGTTPKKMQPRLSVAQPAVKTRRLPRKLASKPEASAEPTLGRSATAEFAAVFVKRLRHFLGRAKFNSDAQYMLKMVAIWDKVRLSPGPASAKIGATIDAVMVIDISDAKHEAVKSFRQNCQDLVGLVSAASMVFASDAIRVYSSAAATRDLISVAGPVEHPNLGLVGVGPS